MATILPTGETQFFDGNGDPLAAGTVTFYIPGTTTAKDTWQNSSQSILNTNPVTLDAAGRAIIYGSGAYRQVVKDQFGNLIWDQDTAEPNQGAVSFGGTSGGTANAQTLSAAQFSGIDGQIISFVAGISNTGAMTISVGGNSPIPVLKNSPSGPVALVAGDVVQGNSYFIQYSSALSAFQLLLSVAPAIPTGPFLQGYLYGLTLANNASDAVNDIDISTGAAGSDGATPVLMTLAGALTKRLDAAWTVGTNQGWLDTGSVADGTYHAYLIQRSDTGVVDSLASLSPTSPTMPANYDRKRRIGSIIRKASTILGFVQDGDYFVLKVMVNDIGAAAPGTSAATRTLTVPLGIRMRVIGTAYTTTIDNVLISDLSIPDQVVSSGAFSTATSGQGGGYFDVFTNTASQVRSRNAVGNGVLNINTRGWVDTRGRT